MRQARALFLTAIAGGALVLGGCSIAQSAPPPTRPFGEIEREEFGEVISVHDTMLDLRTGRVRSTTTSGPMIPIGPIAINVPITVGGESKREVPAEEITVKMSEGKMILIVQETSSPAYAVGERVIVQHEKPNAFTGESRTRVVRPQ